MKTRSVGFIGGGSIAVALIRGLLGAGVEPHRLCVSDPNPERLARLREAYAIRLTRDNRALLRESDIAVVCVEPRVADAVLAELAKDLRPDQVVVSLAAGLSCDAIEARLPAGSRVVRALPNVPAIVGASVTAIAPGTHADADDVQVVRELFEAVGSVVSLGEPLFNAATGLSASGPAYVMLVIEALADGGVKVGLERDVATLLAAQAVLGAAKVLLAGGAADPTDAPAHSSASVERERSLRATCVGAVAAAAGRAEEMGRQRRIRPN